MEYEARLDRALDAVTAVAGAGAEERLSVPEPGVQPDGAFTRLTNVEAIADALDRDPEHLHRAIQRALGTSGGLDAGVARYNGTFDAPTIAEAVDEYVAEYVTCSECGLPDTRLVQEDRTQMLRCEACGAFRPVAKQSTPSTSTADPDAIEEGETYELKITGTGRKGDGVAERGTYTVFVSGASEGDVVSAYVESVSGTLAFARVV